MNGIILETLGLYLNGDIDLDSLEDRIIPLLWSDLSEADRALIAEIAVELVYIKDSLSDESIFRTRIPEISSRVPAVVAD